MDEGGATAPWGVCSAPWLGRMPLDPLPAQCVVHVMIVAQLYVPTPRYAMNSTADNTVSRVCWRQGSGSCGQLQLKDVLFHL